MKTLFPKYMAFFGPALLVSIGYMDPGNWATSIEGGSRFGYDLVWMVFLANFIAILLHSLATHLGVVTGKHLAQACHDQYPTGVCLLLWLISESSRVALDSAMILGTAAGLNLLLGLPVLPGVILGAADILLLMGMPRLMGVHKAELILGAIFGLVLICFVLNAFFSRPTMTAVFGGMWPRLKSDSLYAAVGLLGANIMPHNLYLNSALVEEQRKAGLLSIGCYPKFIDIILTLGAVIIVNVAIMIVAATSFHSAGFSVLALQDGYVLMEQILSRSVAPLAFGLALLCAGILSTLTGTVGGQVASEGFLGKTFDAWFHRLATRAIAVIPAVLCAWKYGNEGIYQMLVLSQVILALQLPFTLVPLIRLTSSTSYMGKQKISSLVEGLAWMVLVFVLSLNLWLVFGTLFAESDDWGGSTNWEFVSGSDWLSSKVGEAGHTFTVATILMVSTLSVGFLVWLIFTPMRADMPALVYPLVTEEYKLTEALKQEFDSQPEKLEAEVYCNDRLSSFQDISEEVNISAATEDVGIKLHTDEIAEDHLVNAKGQVCELCPVSVDNDDTLQEMKIAQQETESCSEDSSAVIEDSVVIEDTTAIIEDTTTVIEDARTVIADVSKDEEFASHSSLEMPCAPLSTEGDSPAIPIVSVLSEATEVSLTEVATVANDILEGTDMQIANGTEVDNELDKNADSLDKDEDDVDGWENLEQEDVIYDASGLGGSLNSLTYEGPESARSIRSDTSESGPAGSGSGSLSRLSGLGRAARRQFAAVLDEFWGKLFDLHGQPVRPGALNSPRSGLRANNGQNDRMERDGPYSLPRHAAKRGQQNLPHSSVDGFGRTYSHLTASTSQGAYGRQFEYVGGPLSSHLGERRYSSMRHNSYHEEYDYQPATIHGYNVASYTNRTSSGGSPRARPLHLDVQSPGSRTAADLNLQAPLRRHSMSRSMSFEPDQAMVAQSLGSRTAADLNLQAPLPRHSTSRSMSFEPDQAMVAYNNYMRAYLPSQETGDGFPTGVAQSSQVADPLADRHGRSSEYDSGQWSPIVNRSVDKWNPLVYRATGELDIGREKSFLSDTSLSSTFGHAPIGRAGSFDYSSLQSERAPLSFDEISPSQTHRDGFSIQATSQSESLWSKQPFEQLFGPPGFVNQVPGRSGAMSKPSKSVFCLSNGVEFGFEVVEQVRVCIKKMLQLEGSDWLFRVDNGCDEDLIAGVAAREKALLDSEFSDPVNVCTNGNPSWQMPSRSTPTVDGSSQPIPGVPHCGDTCVWGSGLLVSFGVWCVQRILELSLMESRPELWGKYTYVLNRLQGIIEPAFSKPRTVLQPCMCLQGYSPLAKRSNGGDLSLSSYPYPWSWGRNITNPNGKPHGSHVFLEMIKEVEAAVGSRKGRTGTAAGDVAFPKGKENLASVLKRYKRRLGNKPGGTGNAVGNGRRTNPMSGGG